MLLRHLEPKVAVNGERRAWDSNADFSPKAKLYFQITPVFDSGKTNLNFNSNLPRNTEVFRSLIRMVWNAGSVVC